MSEVQYKRSQELLLTLNRLSQDSKALMDVLGDDIPENFLDPISFDLLNDPVKLPSSGQILNRRTIKQHLLNDEHDPFNRAPLKYKDLIEVPEFKRQIEEWVKEKMQKNKMKKKAQKGDDMGIEEEKVPDEEGDLDTVMRNLH